jgi:hypothetical protein
VEVPPFEPSTFAEAINCDAKADWAKSMQEEINSLVEQGTWKLVIPPKGAKIISSKWVYKIKTIDGKFERFKSRLVAKGFMQIQSVNYFETYNQASRENDSRIGIVFLLLPETERKTHGEHPNTNGMLGKGLETRGSFEKEYFPTFWLDRP